MFPVPGYNTRRFIAPNGTLVAIHSQTLSVVFYSEVGLLNGVVCFLTTPRHYWADELREVPRGDLHRYH